MKKSVHYLLLVLFGMELLVSCSDEKSGKTTVVSLAKVEKPTKIEQDEIPAKSDSAKGKRIAQPIVPVVIIPEPGPTPEPEPWPWPEPWFEPLPIPEPPPSLLNTENILVISPEVEAEFPGGADSLMRFIRENVRYPEISKELGEQGRVFVQFVVEKDGSLTDLNVLRGVSKPLDLEAKRVIRLMPKWKPAKLNGENVRSKMIVPITYRLD